MKKPCFCQCPRDAEICCKNAVSKLCGGCRVRWIGGFPVDSSMSTATVLSSSTDVCIVAVVCQVHGLFLMAAFTRR